MLSQQAQLERAYLLWKSGRAGAGAGDARALHQAAPDQPGLDYALYLQGLINFNDNLGLFGSLARQDLSERDQQAVARRLSVVHAS